MPQYTNPDERDRHIDPIADADPVDTGASAGYNDEEDADQVGDADLENVEIAENDDGSADVTFPDEKLDENEFSANLAELLDEDVVAALGRDMCDLIELDKEARSKRDKQYEEGIRRSGLGDDAPGGAEFHGASKVVHPILAESCIDFASRAIKELFPPSGPVRTAIFGVEDDDKIEVATRKARYLNWQTTVKMREYRSELEQMLTQLPMGGSQYQKFWYDERFRRPRTEFVPIDDIFLPYSCTDFYTANRVTHVQHLTRLEFEQRVNEGLYADVVDTVISPDFPDKSASATANEKVEGKQEDCYNEDGLRDVYEIYAYQAIEQDDVTGGDIAPYIITVDRYTEKVLAIYRNWEPHDPIFEKLDWLVEWKFIPWRGAYAIGFPHLIGGLSGAATGALRALLDSAHINNSASLVKLKGGKMSGQNLEVEPTQVAEIEGPAGVDDIRKLMMPLPYNPPSTVLFQLLGWLTDAGKGVIATTEEAIANVGDRTPVGTTMAMIEQGAHTYSAIHARLHYSQAKALEILCRINKTFMDDQETVEDLGDLTISREEFAKSTDVIPVSDPNIFSEAQRFAQMQGAAQVRAMFPNQQWNDNAMARRMLERLRVPNVDELLPEPKKPQNMNPSAENVASMHGQPVLALPKQNHLAHIWSHIEFCVSPIFANPIMGSKLMGIMVRHIGEHIGFHYADLMSQFTEFEQKVESMPTKQLEDQLARSNTTVLAKLQNDLSPIMAKLQQIQQMAQQFSPPPPMDPAVKATYDVGMAEVKRKADLDKAKLDIEKQQVTQLQPQLENAKQQVELLKNAHDNIQKHVTELAKNQGDNQTNQWIAALKTGQEQLMQMLQAKLDAEEAALARDHDFTKDAFMSAQQNNADLASQQQQHQHEAAQSEQQQAADAEMAQQQQQADAEAAQQAAAQAAQQSSSSTDQ